MEINTLLTAITIIGGIIGILKAIWYIFKYIVDNIVEPISNNVEQIQEATKDIKAMLDLLKDEQIRLGERLTIVEESSKSAHHRLDDIWKYITEKEGQRNNEVIS